MNTKLELGQYFVGIVQSEDMLPAVYKRRPGIGSVRVMGGDKVSLVVIVCGDAEMARGVMDIYAHLPIGHSHQISNDSAFWVCGVKAWRGDLVRILDWSMRREPFEQKDYE